MQDLLSCYFSIAAHSKDALDLTKLQETTAQMEHQRKYKVRVQTAVTDIQGGDGKGKTENLDVNFSRQGKLWQHRENLNFENFKVE